MTSEGVKPEVDSDLYRLRGLHRLLPRRRPDMGPLGTAQVGEPPAPAAASAKAAAAEAIQVK